ncbi:DUF4113 domain-containing protein [Atlantibacter hermannii]|uniref:DUF4113 domain-containing protein n=1 Tax=Atlantibacter hermannii TaxID=565 RepID=UPI00406C0903
MKSKVRHIFSHPGYLSGVVLSRLDQLNAKGGKGTLFFAGQGIQQQMKRDMLSPRYTTRLSDIPKVG